MLLEIHVNLHPVNFIIISGIFQSIVLASVLLFYRKGSKGANSLIGLLILICSFHFSWSLIIDTNLPDIIKEVFWFPYSYILAIGPLLFFYTRSLTESNFQIRVKDSIHFLPVAVEVLVQLILITESIRNNILFYNVQGFLMFRIFEFIGTGISILVYGKRCLALIKIHEVWVVENFSNQKDITLLWLIELIKYLRVLWIFWLVFELVFILFWQFHLHLILVYLLLYILLGVITYSTFWIGIKALIKSEVLVERKKIDIPPKHRSVYSRMNDVEIKEHVEALNQLMIREKLYLYETLSLRMLANRLQMDPNLLSYVLNNILQRSFYDYINEFRIGEIKRKLDDPAYSHLKIVEIAFECGFNSKASFNRVFKKVTGTSPSEYKKGSSS